MSARVPGNGREVRAALRALGARPSRKLGQNFLVDRGVLRKVADAAAAAPGDLVLEIGPGLGALTVLLAEAGASVVAVEIDLALARFLREAFEGEERVRIVEADALDGHGGLSRELIASVAEADAGRTGRFLVAANLPYSVATPAILALLLREPPPDEMVVMIQREVADRLRAAPSTPEYGPLSVLVRSVARVDPVLSVPGRCFHPVPAVGSSVVRIAPDSALRAAAGDLAALRDLVHASFGMRRKTLGNNLAKAGVATPEVLAAAGVDPGRRAESLSPEEFTALAKALSPLANGPRGGDTPGDHP